MFVSSCPMPVLAEVPATVTESPTRPCRARASSSLECELMTRRVQVAGQRVRPVMTASIVGPGLGNRLE